MKKHSLMAKALVVAFISIVAVSAAEAKNKKYGLFIGINAYTGGITPLKGCVNDATSMRDAMTSKFGFNVADTTLLTDAAATRDGIIAGIKKYEAVAGPGDIFVMHYSGHGTLFPDKYTEEQDETKLIYMEIPNDAGQMEVLYERGTYDSALVPFDARSKTSGKPWRNLILDDELYAMLGAITRKGAQVVLISDSCHSGSIDKARASDATRRAESLATVFGVRRFSELDLEAPATTRTTRTPPPVSPLYLSMTGAKDDEFSLDVSYKGKPMGLFTYNFIQEVNKIVIVPKKPITMNYQQIMAVVAKNVSEQAGKWSNNQNPQLNFAYGNPRMALFSVPAAK
ncbi:MAG TPA: caspase family protein [Pyrinomonadaceae bacterium]|nr:caspase family protein [Pyrinomonadaceae bacterium]